jgi:hypothetical protein
LQTQVRVLPFVSRPFEFRNGGAVRDLTKQLSTMILLCCVCMHRSEMLTIPPKAARAQDEGFQLVRVHPAWFESIRCKSGTPSGYSLGFATRLMDAPETPLQAKTEWCIRNALQWPALCVAVAEELRTRRLKERRREATKTRARKDLLARRTETAAQKRARLQKRNDRRRAKKNAQQE